jgi:hypothetical protein
MLSSRSVTSLNSQFLHSESIETSLLEWIRTFGIDSRPQGVKDLYTGVALYEVLNKVDMIYWPKSKLQRVDFRGGSPGVQNF